MNVKVPFATTTGPVAPLPSPPAEQLAEVLLAELVRTLGAEARPGTVLGGRPHLRLFGEAIDLALPLRALRRLSEVAPAPSLELDDDTLRRHARAIADDEGYLLSPAGLHPDDDAPADAMSLRLYTSPFSRPMNALLRADPADPQTWLQVVDELRHACQRASACAEGSGAPASLRRMARLGASLEGLDRLDDPRLPRLLGEQLVHACMAVHALLRQRRVRGGDERRLRACCALPEPMLAELRWVATHEHDAVWRDPGLLGASPHPGHRCPHDPARPDVLEIRPRLHGSAGRWLDGSVVFPPGTPFEVLEVLEAAPRAREPSDGMPRVVVRLVELPSRRAVSAWTTR